jgi:acid phosphatase type 7
VLSGHVHAYQRNDPLNDSFADLNGLNNPKSPWYITNGAGGHYDGLDALQVPLQSFAKVAINDTYGWSRLTFHNCSHLTHEFVASRNGSVIDSATLFKDHSCSTLVQVNATTTASASIPSVTRKSSATALVAGVGLTAVGLAVTVVFGMPILL